MSGTGRDAGGMNAGTSGSSSMGDRGLGSAEVHTGLHSGGTDQYSGLQFAGHEQDTGNSRLRGVADAVRDRIPEGVRNLGSKAGGATSGVRERLSGVNERATGMLESRGLLDRLRENPLPVLGVAFALGFLLSGRDDDDDDDFEPTRASRARSELRSALMAGVSAGIAQGARGFLGQASTEGGSFVNTLLDSLMGGGKSGESQGGAQGGASRSGGQPSYGGSRAGAGGGATGGGYGGSAASSRGGSTGGGTAGRSGPYGGGGSTGRPPSHQEY